MHYDCDCDAFRVELEVELSVGAGTRDPSDCCSFFSTLSSVCELSKI